MISGPFQYPLSPTTNNQLSAFRWGFFLSNRDIDHSSKTFFVVYGDSLFLDLPCANSALDSSSRFGASFPESDNECRRPTTGMLGHLIVISGRPVIGPNNLKQKKDKKKQDGSEWNDGKMLDSSDDLPFLHSRLEG
jgi:hypothetical protein